MSLKRQREEPCYICGHYHNYEGGEQCKVCGHMLHTAQVSAEQVSAMPSEILPSFLYLGSYDHASRSELLKAMGITHILSVVPGCQQLYKNSFEYHTVSSSPADFEECFQFLDKAKGKQTRILVHCMTGASRSSIVVMAYLMRLRQWSLQESYQWVKDRHRPCVISEGDTARLRQFEHLELQSGKSEGVTCPKPRAQGGTDIQAHTSNGQAFQSSQSFHLMIPGQPLIRPNFSFVHPDNPSEVFLFGSQQPQMGSAAP